MDQVIIILLLLYIHILQFNVDEKHVGNKTVENCKQDNKTAKILLQRYEVHAAFLTSELCTGASRETKKSTLDPCKILSASVSMRDEQTKSGPIEVKQIGIQFDTSKSKEKIVIVKSQNKKV